MIARPLPQEEGPRPRTGTRAGRSAVGRRRARTRRERYAALARIFAIIATLVFLVVVYLALMANVTRMNYELTKLAQQRAQLVDRTAAYDDAIASEESDERLWADARKLRMTEPQTFVSIALPRDPPRPSAGIAFLGWLRGASGGFAGPASEGASGGFAAPTSEGASGGFAGPASK